MDSVVHFEIPADDMSRAKKFYGGVFGWKLMDMPGGGGQTYTLATTGETVDEKSGMLTKPNRINGGIMPKDKASTHTTIVVGVRDINETLEKVKKSGGKVISEVIDIPMVGKYARVHDTEGNLVAIIQPTNENIDEVEKWKVVKE